MVGELKPRFAEMAMLRWCLVALVATNLGACKVRRANAPAADVEEAGAGHIDNPAWFKRFGARFDPKLVAAAVLRIDEIGATKGDDLLSHVAGWPANGPFPPLPAQGVVPYFTSYATGFFIAPNGLGMTNDHVMDGCARGRVLNQPRKCPTYRAYVSTVFLEKAFLDGDPETKLNNALVSLAEQNRPQLAKDPRIESGDLSLNYALAAEVKARMLKITEDTATPARTFDVCLVSASGGTLDVDIVKFVPVGADCSENLPPQAFFALQLSPAEVGKRVFSAGFGETDTAYAQQLRNSKAELFSKNELNFATGIVGRVDDRDVATVTDKSLYQDDQTTRP